MRRELWQPEEFEARLRKVGEERYHSLHPFNVEMNDGRLSPEQLRAWVVNRFVYQTSIPIKDAAILSNCPVREVRRLWIRRIIDHDGTTEGSGGIESWLRLAEALGISREEMLDHRHVLPGARFAAEAYVNFCRFEPWPIAVASSLTEMFAPDHMRTRVAAMEKLYPWIPTWGYDYFRARFTLAANDSNEALDITLRYCDTPELQDRAVKALYFKCDVLWSLLDSIRGVNSA